MYNTLSSSGDIDRFSVMVLQVYNVLWFPKHVRQSFANLFIYLFDI
jgi:hypothetical protein